MHPHLRQKSHEFASSILYVILSRTTHLCKAGVRMRVQSASPPASKSLRLLAAAGSHQHLQHLRFSLAAAAQGRDKTAASLASAKAPVGCGVKLGVRVGRGQEEVRGDGVSCIARASRCFLARSLSLCPSASLPFCISLSHACTCFVCLPVGLCLRHLHHHVLQHSRLLLHYFVLLSPLPTRTHTRAHTRTHTHTHTHTHDKFMRRAEALVRVRDDSSTFSEVLPFPPA